MRIPSSNSDLNRDASPLRFQVSSLPIFNYDMPFLEAVKASLRCPIERVTAVEDASDFEVGKIENGVMILLADWSAPACLALAGYSERLNVLNPNIPVWIVNVDSFEPVGAILSHGWGEVYFFRKGRLIDQLLRSKEDMAARFAEKFEAFFPK